MKTRYKLVALDLDGTLLSARGELSTAVRQAIAAVQSQGVQVTLATGRRACRTLPWARALHIEVPVVAHNGAVVVDPQSGRFYCQQGISITVANELIGELHRLNLPYLVYRGEDQGEMGMLTAQFAEHKTEFLTYIDDQLEITENLFLEAAPIKIAVLAKAEQMKEVVDAWHRRYGHAANMITYKSDGYIGVDFVPPNCSKASGIGCILSLLELDFSHVLAIGDDYNDLALIQAAGFGVAMGHAPVTVKQHADFIAPSGDQDGVAYVLKRFLLRETE
ncbi:MAG TPA: HAD family phosphatase [Firmicutes bacterium]|mgnify:CR=1 FL=1|nr:HAD family phosphatase [Bacillota bacterium]